MSWRRRQQKGLLPSRSLLPVLSRWSGGVAALIRARQEHGALEVLWHLQLHVHADGIRQAAGE
jgi:hypothetical protein